jgi:hypothetical protein
MKRFSILFLTLSTYLLMSCGEEVQQRTYNYEKADSLSADYLQELGSVRVNIEQSSKLYALMTEKGYSFDNTLVISPGKSYSTSKQQALGLGMYGADLSYSTIFGQTQGATEYMKSIVQLSEKMGIPEAFDQELLGKLTSDDSTINKSILLTKAYIKATDQLYSEDRAKLVVMMVAGGWIQGLSISSNAALKKGSADSEIIMGIYDQVYSFENTYKMLEVFKDDKDVSDVYQKIHEVKPQFDRLIHSKGRLTESHLQEIVELTKSLKSQLVS